MRWTWGENAHERWETSHARWVRGKNDHARGRMVTQGDFCMVEGTSYTFSPKVISHPCKMAKLAWRQGDFGWDVTLVMSKVQMMKIFRNFPIIDFCKVTLHGYSHLTSTLCDYFPPCVGILTSYPPHMTSFPPHMQGEITHTRWMWGENAHARWEMVTQGGCEVRMPMQSGKWSHEEDARWEYGHARWMWGENAYMRWETGHARWMRGKNMVAWGGHEMRMPIWGGKLVMQGENGQLR